MYTRIIRVYIIFLSENRQWFLNDVNVTFTESFKNLRNIVHNHYVWSRESVPEQVRTIQIKILRKVIFLINHCHSERANRLQFSHNCSKVMFLISFIRSKFSYGCHLWRPSRLQMFEILGIYNRFFFSDLLLTWVQVNESS